jgi:hypothetical protein
MNAILFDPSLSDDARREQLYKGQLFVYSPSPSSRELCAFARSDRGCIGSLDPREAQHSLPVQDYVAILTKLKPAFIHHLDQSSCFRAS